MPIHDWSRVDAGIFHDFHHAWIEQIKRLLNSGVLPPDHYAMAEQHTSHFGPDVLKNVVAVRHVSGDRLVAIVEIVSPGNKSSQAVFRKFVDKAVELLSQDIHLLILDLIAPTRRDPNGIHGAIWEALTDEEYKAPSGKPLTLAAYEAEMGVRAFVESVAVGDALPEMPLFLKAGGHVPVALESTYESAWEAVPRRWRSVIEG
jgi:Protein of unknown function (DUF4058)